MTPIHHLRRVAGVLAGLACAWLSLALAAPAAFALGPPTPGPAGYLTPTAEPPPIREKHPPLRPAHIHQPVHQAPAPTPVHTVVAGMPGWQIALIAMGAALLAAIAAVVVYRAWTARRKTIATAA